VGVGAAPLRLACSAAILSGALAQRRVIPAGRWVRGNDLAGILERRHFGLRPARFWTASTGKTTRVTLSIPVSANLRPPSRPARSSCWFRLNTAATGQACYAES